MAKSKHTYVDFTQEPFAPQFAKTTYAVATAADNQEDFVKTQDGDYFEWIQTGANTVIFLQPRTSAPLGWTIPCDKTDADGVEITQGIVSGAVGTRSFTIGTDPAFFIQVTASIADIQDLDVFQVGFRRLAAYADITTPATLNAYTDAAWCGINTAAGAFSSNTELNNGGLVATAATHAAHVNTEYVTLRTNVSAAGVVTYLIGTGATAAASRTALAADTALTAVSFTFDSTDIVVPSIVLVATGTAAAPAVVLQSYECGYQNL